MPPGAQAILSRPLSVTQAHFPTRLRPAESRQSSYGRGLHHLLQHHAGMRRPAPRAGVSTARCLFQVQLSFNDPRWPATAWQRCPPFSPRDMTVRWEKKYTLRCHGKKSLQRWFGSRLRRTERSRGSPNMPFSLDRDCPEGQAQQCLSRRRPIPTYLLLRVALLERHPAEWSIGLRGVRRPSRSQVPG
jgi:hypothetical protein